MIKRIAGACASIIVGFAVFSPASMAETVREKPNPWLDCGIGAMIFPDSNLEVGAGISNIIWDLGTTAVTSAQSSPDTCAGMDNVKSAMFIQNSYDQLELELAKGKGEHLVALSELMGCQSDVRSDYVNTVRADMADKFAAPGYVDLSRDEKAQALYFAADRVAKDEFAGQCAAI